jgi:uracil-DNA glycosylase family 4
MPNRITPSTRELARQVRYHVESLHAAGMEWIPAARPRAVQQGPAGATSLFAELIQPATGNEPPGEVRQCSPLPSAEKRGRDLKVLADTISTCARCPELCSTRTQTVFGVGKIDPELCFIGEAPGADEDATGEPFVGAAGQLLNRIIAACGMKRNEVYICNIIKCRPPGNRLPQIHEAGNCREYLDKQLELIRPKFICALGACAAQNLLDTKAPIGRLRGQFHNYRGISVLCTYHPAYLLRSPDKKKDVWEDMKKLLQRMGRPIK